jgi:hypothetical protein
VVQLVSYLRANEGTAAARLGASCQQNDPITTAVSETKALPEGRACIAISLFEVNYVLSCGRLAKVVPAADASAKPARSPLEDSASGALRRPNASPAKFPVPPELLAGSRSAATKNDFLTSRSSSGAHLSLVRRSLKAGP